MLQNLDTVWIEGNRHERKMIFNTVFRNKLLCNKKDGVPTVDYSVLMQCFESIVSNENVMVDPKRIELFTCQCK